MWYQGNKLTITMAGYNYDVRSDYRCVKLRKIFFTDKSQDPDAINHKIFLSKTICHPQRRVILLFKLFLQLTML